MQVMRNSSSPQPPSTAPGAAGEAASNRLARRCGQRHRRGRDDTPHSCGGPGGGRRSRPDIAACRWRAAVRRSAVRRGRSRPRSLLPSRWPARRLLRRSRPSARVPGWVRRRVASIRVGSITAAAASSRSQRCALPQRHQRGAVASQSRVDEGSRSPPRRPGLNPGRPARSPSGARNRQDQQAARPGRQGFRAAAGSHPMINASRYPTRSGSIVAAPRPASRRRTPDEASYSYSCRKAWRRPLPPAFLVPPASCDHPPRAYVPTSRPNPVVLS